MQGLGRVGPMPSVRPTYEDPVNRVLWFWAEVGGEFQCCWFHEPCNIHALKKGRCFSHQLGCHISCWSTWVQVLVLLLTPAACWYRSWDAALVGQVAGFLPSPWQTGIGLPASSSSIPVTCYRYSRGLATG